MVKFKQKGDFSKLSNFLEKTKEKVKFGTLDKYGKECVIALSKATPIDSGDTANSWYYEIERKNGVSRINFHNSNVNAGITVAIIIQYGHATRNGGWVEGIDYINPAAKKVFDKAVSELWKEVVR